MAAQQAVAALRAARIEGFVATDDCGGLFPPLGANRPFRLIVSAVHREAAEQVLAENAPAALEETPVGNEPPLADHSASAEPPSPSPSTLRPLWIFLLGIVVGALGVILYQRSRESFTGTVPRDLNHDGRADAWDSYKNGQYSSLAYDNNGDGQPDTWYYYNDGVVTKWEADVNFDGKIDMWVSCDQQGLPNESKADVDFDGQPDTIERFQFGRVSERHSVLPRSGLVWKKSYFTNGLMREELIDRDRDGKFDEKLLFDVHGVEVNKVRLNRTN
jgi:hypothetical protein